jgi:hypothetical protein
VVLRRHPDFLELGPTERAGDYSNEGQKPSSSRRPDPQRGELRDFLNYFFAPFLPAVEHGADLYCSGVDDGRAGLHSNGQIGVRVMPSHRLVEQAFELCGQR